MTAHNLSTTVRRIARSVAATSLLLLIAISPATAQTDETGQVSGGCGDMPPQFQEIAELLTRVQQLGVALALLIASVMLIYGGILWMRGTPDAQQKARRIIWNTLIGLVIVLMAGGLVGFVKSVLCGGA